MVGREQACRNASGGSNSQDAAAACRTVACCAGSGNHSPATTAFANVTNESVGITSAKACAASASSPAGGGAPCSIASTVAPAAGAAG